MKRLKTILLALAIATIFAAADQYVMNLSSYLVGGMFAYWWVEIRAKKGEG